MLVNEFFAHKYTIIYIRYRHFAKQKRGKGLRFDIKGLTLQLKLLIS